MLADVTLSPIGVIRTPFADRLSAPRQPTARGAAEGTVELFPGRSFEHALEDLEGWERIWLVFLFHLNQGAGFRPKVLPPRSERKRGVFATRSPHRPNPIGLSAVRLVKVSGLVLHVRDLDIVDGTPLLDIKPYVPYADAFPDARTGWLAPAEDPAPSFEVTWSELAREQVAWILAEHGVDLEPQVTAILTLGPQPHPYRRIKADGDGFRLALHDWRARFVVEGREVTVTSIRSGYRPAQLAEPASPAIAVQAAFVRRFPQGVP
jgi:tRNA-Thr(GGU) m(6)t(6)A37 methyltransferase TsaA